MLAKSLDLCASSQNHQTPWQYYNNGHLERDDTFNIVELCHFNFQSTMTQVGTRIPPPSLHYYSVTSRWSKPPVDTKTKVAF